MFCWLISTNHQRSNLRKTKSSSYELQGKVRRGCPESKHLGLLADSTWMSVSLHSESYFGIDISELDV